MYIILLAQRSLASWTVIWKCCTIECLSYLPLVHIYFHWIHGAAASLEMPVSTDHNFSKHRSWCFFWNSGLLWNFCRSWDAHGLRTTGSIDQGLVSSALSDMGVLSSHLSVILFRASGARLCGISWAGRLSPLAQIAFSNWMNKTAWRWAFIHRKPDSLFDDKIFILYYLVVAKTTVCSTFLKKSSGPKEVAGISRVYFILKNTLNDIPLPITECGLPFNVDWHHSMSHFQSILFSSSF